MFFLTSEKIVAGPDLWSCKNEILNSDKNLKNFLLQVPAKVQSLIGELPEA